MPAKTSASLLTVALVGNPNTGKSTLFSALAGVRQRIGNYPGVTVEKKIGHLEIDRQRFELVDLPGTYSLAPRSPDEMVAVDVLLARRHDVRPIKAVLSIVDASNLERNLYLVSQVLELGLPTIVVLNMVDVARSRGLAIDVERLRRQLGVPVVEVQANKKLGLDQLREQLAAAAESHAAAPVSPFPPEFQAEVQQLESALLIHGAARMPRYLVERLLLDSAGYLEGPFLDAWYGEPQAAAVRPQLLAARARLAEAGSPVPAIEAVSRYGWVGRVLEGVVERPKQRVVTRGDALDRVLTGRFTGTIIFVALMLVVFSSIFLWAKPAMKLVEAAVGWIGSTAADSMPPGAVRSMVVDGVIGGVGSVLVFLPQIMILFFFIAVLEDCGYMARAAYLMDRLMVRVGLSGKSFIPLLSSFACAIPGVMATRVIENRRDRLTTILVAPLMSCSARLPVYTVLIGAFIPAEAVLGGWVPLQGLTLLAMYLVGIVAAALVALVLKRTLLRGPTPPFVMELPSYKWPSPKLVAWRVLERAWGFIYRAGTLILAVSVVVWAAQYFPHDEEAIEGPFRAQQADLRASLASPDVPSEERELMTERLGEIDRDISSQYQQQSYLGQMGHFIEPAVRPLGWDWRIGCAAIASFPAREVVMGALGVLYNLGDDIDVEEEGDRNRLMQRLRAARHDDTGELVYNIPVALSIMVFFALCAQCASTLVIIKRETNSWGWPIFTFGYMTALAYVAALATYQTGMWLSG